jgi:hypothetical protein
VRADGRINFDFAVSKRFTFGEGSFLQFRADFLNAFNHPDFALPNNILSAGAFGAISEATEPRSIQLGLRLVF